MESQMLSDSVGDTKLKVRFIHYKHSKAEQTHISVLVLQLQVTNYNFFVIKVIFFYLNIRARFEAR